MVEKEKRRQEILHLLHVSSEPITGTKLASNFSVSRQVIVQDIAILRASGEQVISTPQGYILLKTVPRNWVRTIVACQHTREQIEDELGIVIELGGRVLDVIVEHPVYGQLQGSLMIAGRRDLNIFLEHLNESGAHPLSALTDGNHLHTLEAPEQKVMDKIIADLDRAGYLLK